VRAALIALLALMLVMRVGPICEAVAIAAVPSAPAMPGCEGKGHGTPEKKAPTAACSMPCAAALDGAPIARVAPLAYAAPGPWPVRHAGLLEFARAPATPPPRAV
jgi:hypothetical protein